MKIKKSIFAGMVALALSFGLMLTGCATTQFTWEETETSTAIFEAASEIVLAQETTAGELLSGLGNRFPGLRAGRIMPIISVGSIQVIYEGRQFRIRCDMGTGDAIEGTGGAATAVGVNTIVTNILYVREWVEAEEAD